MQYVYNLFAMPPDYNSMVFIDLHQHISCLTVTSPKCLHPFDCQRAVYRVCFVICE